MTRYNALRDHNGKQHAWIRDQALYCLEAEEWRSAAAIIWSMGIYSQLPWPAMKRYLPFRDAVLGLAEGDIAELGRVLGEKLADLECCEC